MKDEEYYKLLLEVLDEARKNAVNNVADIGILNICAWKREKGRENMSRINQNNKEGKMETKKEEDAKRIIEKLKTLKTNGELMFIVEDAKNWMGEHCPPVDERYEKWKELHKWWLLIPGGFQDKRVFNKAVEMGLIAGERDTTLIDEAIAGIRFIFSKKAEEITIKRVMDELIRIREGGKE